MEEVVAEQEEKINGLIYIFENKINHKLYVGQTTYLLKKRVNVHFAMAKKFKEQNKNSKFHNALNKYGREGFHIYIIDKSDTIEELNHKEYQWIKLLKTINNGYNSKEGGKNAKHSKESCEKMSMSRKGIKFTDKAKENMSKSFKKRYDNPEYAEKCKKRLTEYNEKVRNREIMPSGAKQVICLTTNEIFDSIASASKKYKITPSAITANCTGKTYECQKLKFAFYSDYLNNTYNKKRKFRQIICIETKEIFESHRDITKKFNVSRGTIGNSVRNGYSSSWYNNYHFAYYDIYSENINIRKNKVYKKIKCIETGEIFDKIKNACVKYNIEQSHMTYKIKHNLPTNGFHFEYLNKEIENSDTNILEAAI